MFHVEYRGNKRFLIEDAWQVVEELHPDIAKVRPNDFVKLNNGTERFWVRVENMYPNHTWSGCVQNYLIHTNMYTYGEYVIFQPKHVLEYIPASM